MGTLLSAEVVKIGRKGLAGPGAAALLLLLVAFGCGPGEEKATPPEPVGTGETQEALDAAPPAEPAEPPSGDGIREESLPPDEAGDTEEEEDGGEEEEGAGLPGPAYARIDPRSGSELSGTAAFTTSSDGLDIAVELAGLSPGEHGLHIHEVGDCSAEDASSAGGHFNPEGKPHGGPSGAEHHAGDLGNILIKEDGKGRLFMTTEALTLASGPNSVIGRAIVVHEKSDDLKSQPSGASGARIGCGVIKPL